MCPAHICLPTVAQHHRAACLSQKRLCITPPARHELVNKLDKHNICMECGSLFHPLMPTPAQGCQAILDGPLVPPTFSPVALTTDCVPWLPHHAASCEKAGQGPSRCLQPCAWRALCQALGSNIVGCSSGVPPQHYAPGWCFQDSPLAPRWGLHALALPPAVRWGMCACRTQALALRQGRGCPALPSAVRCGSCPCRAQALALRQDRGCSGRLADSQRQAFFAAARAATTAARAAGTPPARRAPAGPPTWGCAPAT